MTRPLLAALLCSATLLAAPLRAQESLDFATTNTEQHPLVTRVLTPWVDGINADGDAVAIEFRHGPTIANHTNFYDRVQDDVVQIVWGMTVFDPGRFPRALVSTLPFLVPDSETGSLALCRIHEQGAFGDEMAPIVPLLFVQFPQASLHLNGAPLRSMDDMAGKRIITGSPIAAAIVQAYGGTPLSIPITEQYESLQRNTADGTMMNFTAFPAFRLHEVTTDHFTLPLGGALGLVFMSRERWDALSEEARAVLRRHSECEASRTAGARVDEWEAGAMAMVQSQPGHTMTAATPEQLAEAVGRLGAGIEAGFAARVPGGADLIALFRAELDRAAAE